MKSDATAMSRYSIFSLARHALRGHVNWPRAWRDPQPKSTYDVIVVGGGGHGLATAYYLAKNHDVTKVAVLEKGWLGGGNTGRNTTIVRSNYLLQANAQFYEHSLKLWEGLSRELNYNVMFSQRGVLYLAHSDAHMDAHARRGNAMRLNGIDAVLLDRAGVRAMVPDLDFSPGARFPIQGALLQQRGGTARRRHHPELRGHRHPARGRSRRRRGDHARHDPRREGGLAVAGNSGHVAAMAGLRLPIETHLLEAAVSEPLKPCLDTVVTSGAAHVYVSQFDKGELVFGGDLEFYNSYSQRGNLPAVTTFTTALIALFPRFSRLRMMRSWGGAVDMTMDGSPIIGKTPLRNFYIDGGWCYGGFKATPASRLGLRSYHRERRTA
jgi:glycine/D-amino acid oxidase-like deaminating enzyme